MDLNGNGHMDILSGSWPGEIFFFQRRPNGTYASGETLKGANGRAINVGRASAVTAADWNGDGKPDLLIGNIDGDVYLVPQVKPSPRPVFGAPVRLTTGAGEAVRAPGRYSGPFIADWDMDGRPDLLLGTGSGAVLFYRNTGTADAPRLAEPAVLVPEFTGAPALDQIDRSTRRVKVTVADWNGNGLPDLIVGDFFSADRQHYGWVWVYLRKEATTARVTNPPGPRQE